MTACEVSGFSALSDDDEVLSAPDPKLQLSFAHCRDIALTAESAEADLFARHVLPRLDHGPLAFDN